MIRAGYKVVGADRTSCVVSGKYILQYPLGETVSAVKGSLGIMIFDTYAHASDFVHKVSPNTWWILLVTYDARTATRPKGICGCFGEYNFNLYYNKRCRSLDTSDFHPPPGTLACPKIKVIGEEVTPQ